MPKLQVATNKKASSAVTLKASHLTVISSAGNRPMNNTTATDFNSQIDQAYNTASEALDLVTLSLEVIQGLDTLLDTINLHIRNSQNLDKIASLAKLGLYYTDNQYSNLVVQKGDLEKHLKVLGGSHE